jgi:hypothetical protein
MRESERADCFVVVNGPEDGTEFPVLRAPFHIGRDYACAVNLRLDGAVRSMHAEVSVVSDGYRVRRADVAPVYVNGRRAGMLRSRIVRHGGQVQVGETLLTVECSPDGLANRSHGIISESDLGWALHQATHNLWLVNRGAVHLIVRLFGKLFGSWLAFLFVLGLLYWFWPFFRAWVNHFAAIAYYRIASFILS